MHPIGDTEGNFLDSSGHVKNPWTRYLRLKVFALGDDHEKLIVYVMAEFACWLKHKARPFSPLGEWLNNWLKCCIFHHFGHVTGITIPIAPDHRILAALVCEVDNSGDIPFVRFGLKACIRAGLG